MSNRRSHNLIAIAAAALWGSGVYFAHATGHLHFLDRLESTLTDFRTLVRGVKIPPDLVTIVAIDDAVVKRGGHYPLARADLARVVEAVAKFEPKLVALDLLLLDRGPDDGDAELARSLAERPSVIAAAAVFRSGREAVAAANEGPLASLPQAERFLLPLAAFAAHAEVGIVNVSTGQTGAPLSMPMLFRTRDRIELSFPLRVATLALEKPLTVAPGHLAIGDRSVAIDADYALPITYYGPRRTIRTVSAQSVFDGTLDADAIRDRVVVIGAAVSGGGDFFPTPFDSLMPGVEVISTAITHLMTGDGIVHDRAARGAEAIMAALLPMLLVGLLALRRAAVGLVVAATIFLAWAALNVFAFSHGIWLHASVTLAATVPPVATFAAVQLWVGGRRAQFLAARSRLLAQFQAPAVREWLARDPDFLLKPVRQNAAVLFIDLSGFTALSERLDPDELRDLLKELHALIEREAAGCDGTVTDYLGDGAMILFGLPREEPDDAARAVDCCVRLHRMAECWIASLPPDVGSQIGFKIGAHFGTVVASRLGGRSHAHITATGDTVNVASRLMEVAAQNGAGLALSDSLLNEAGRDGGPLSEGRLVGPLRTLLRGRTGELTVWLWHNDLQLAQPTPEPGTVC